MISLGGSRIVPGDIDDKFLIKFKELIDSHPTHRFAVVTGGGATARKYISALRRLGKSTKKQSIEGIAITRFGITQHGRFNAFPHDKSNRPRPNHGLVNNTLTKE